MLEDKKMVLMGYIDLIAKINEDEKWQLLEFVGMVLADGKDGGDLYDDLEDTDSVEKLDICINYLKDNLDVDEVENEVDSILIDNLDELGQFFDINKVMINRDDLELSSLMNVISMTIDSYRNSLYECGETE